MNWRVDEGPRNATLLLGLLMTPVGSLFLLWAWAHATMVDPALHDSEWFAAVMRNLFRGAKGWFVAACGLLAILGATSVIRYFMKVPIGTRWVGMLLIAIAAWFAFGFMNA